ncbi:MAG: SpoIID/LytB domain-containing protein [Gemmiger sp.]
MLATQQRVLRVFGVSTATVTAILRTAQKDGCPGLRLLEKDGEYAICVQASAPTQAMADSYCDKWVKNLALRFDAAVCGVGEISLARATLEALLKKRRLIVAADEQTGRILGNALRPLEHSEAVFDFGTQTYGDPDKARRIVTPQALLKKFPGDVVQAAAGRAQTAMQVGGADYAAVYTPATVGQAPFVLLCDKRGAVATAVNPDLSENAIANHILDLARRRAMGMRMSDSTISFRPGHDAPLLIVSQEGMVDTQPLPLDSIRSSIKAGGKRLFGSAVPGVTEPVAEHTEMDGRPRAAMPAEDEDEEDTTEYAVVKLDQPETPAAHSPQDAAAIAAAARAAASQQKAKFQPEDAESVDDLSAKYLAMLMDGEEDDGETDATGVVRLTPEPQPEKTTEQKPQPSRAAGTSEDAASAAAKRFAAMRPSGAIRFEEDAQPRRPAQRKPAPQPEPTADLGQVDRPQPPHSILDDEVPEFTMPLPGERRSMSSEEIDEAAKKLFDPSDAEDVGNPIKNKSLAMIERSERRQERTVRILLCAVILIVAAVAVGLFWFFTHNLGQKPSPRSYGTAAFDNKAAGYLSKAAAQDGSVAGYLAFPGAEGSLVYSAEHSEKSTAFGGALADSGESGGYAPRLTGEIRLDAQYPSNTVIDCGTASLAGMANQQTLEENCGFTLYTQAETYRYKVLAVYYWDPADTQENGFDPTAGDLSVYYDYLNFVWNLHARSLFDTGVAVPDDSRFLTLVSDSDEDGIKICVTGRRIETGEDAQLVGSAVTPNEQALLTEAQYRTQGRPVPDTKALLSEAMDWYAQREQAVPASASAEEESASSAGTLTGDELSQQIEALQSQTDDLLASADKLIAGLSDVATNGKSSVETDLHQGAEGDLPETTVSVEEILSTPTPAPDSGSDQGGSQAPESSDSSGSSSAEGETINVTLNGTRQTMDLVTCLAMVAQNELGSNAPLEAYKAQCVATHCWILSQGGYPSVLGATPGAAALQAAQEVAHVLVTYNGQVCFTPYFASASTGTASAKDVWGNERAYLQAVDSPYDRTTATNWNTNGNATGCARFSADALCQAVLEKTGIDLSGVDKNQWFKILSTNSYGWVTQMQIGPDGGQNTTCSGRWFRETLTAGKSVDGRSLRSHCFTFTYNADLDCFIFDVYGYGHGCGLSQWGAVGYANQGWTYDAILTHYFTGVTLTTY